jgi:hypothetical protein
MTKLTDLIELEEAKEDEILVPGLGKYTHKSLQTRLEAQAKDLFDRTKKHEYQRIGKGNLNAFIAMWEAMSKYMEKK